MLGIFGGLKSLWRAQSDLCVPPVNCSMHPTRCYASPVSSCTNHFINAPGRTEKSFSQPKPPLGFFRFSLLVSDIIKCDIMLLMEKKIHSILKSFSCPLYQSCFAFVKFRPHVCVSEISLSMWRARGGCIYFSKEQSSPDILFYVGRNDGMAICLLIKIIVSQRPGNLICICSLSHLWLGKGEKKISLLLRDLV